MPNVHGLFSNRDESDGDSEDDANNRFVGGIGDHGGGRWVRFESMASNDDDSFHSLTHHSSIAVALRCNPIWPTDLRVTVSLDWRKMRRRKTRRVCSAPSRW